MKIALLQPNLDEKYQTQKQAYGSTNRPPETGLAILKGWVTTYSQKLHQMEILNPNKRIEELARESSEYDLLGLTDWFSNHDNCTTLAREVKLRNPRLKVVLGGPNASMIPQEILANHPAVDYVVSRDGEDALVALADGLPTGETPNLWYRAGERINFTHLSFTDLKKMPLWDFSNFQSVDKRLSEYLNSQNSGLDPWLTPPLTLFSFRGCSKAMKKGVCSYCTSSETQGRSLAPEKFWEQVVHLNEKYNAETFYMADDIFTVSPRRILSIAETKPTTAKSKIRAYGYLPDLAKLTMPKLKAMAKNLERIGVFNLFFGSEHYDENVLTMANKEGTTVDDSLRVIKTIFEFGGVKTTIACLLGLPGESRESLQKNLYSLEQLLNYSDGIDRLYISVAMPLKGTPLCKNLELNEEIKTEYANKTGKRLVTDDSPNYSLLSRLSVKYTTSTSPDEINRYLIRIIDSAKAKMPDYRIGGFMLNEGI